VKTPSRRVILFEHPQLRLYWRQVFVFYCEPETSGQGEELQVITKAQEVLR
jgi:hypothetical protein